MFLADLHIHSSYSRATSRDCVPEYLELWARRKGLDLIGTGDFTHPAWRAELREKLEPAEEGLYVLKESFRQDDRLGGKLTRPRFVVTGEISCIYKKNDKVRKVHNVILLPGLEEAEALARRLEEVGNLHSDGRPILGLDSRDLLEITLKVCPTAVFIPAHIWTPHFSLFGKYSGFDTVEECFGDLTPEIHALETGLSADPAMIWRLSALDGYTLLSNSDAHSPQKLAREANLFNTTLSYPALKRALEHPEEGGVAGTIEFFPEEGKYHYDGHRNCHTCLKPSDTIRAGGVCPVCGKKVTVGVLHRVEELADRPEGYRPAGAKAYESLVPLPEVIAASLGCGAASKKVQKPYDLLRREIGPELFILREAPLSAIQQYGGACVAEGVRRLRKGEVEVHPGYDGEYGRVQILDEQEIRRLSGQLFFYTDEPAEKTAEAPEPIPLAQQQASPKEETAPARPATPYGLNGEQWEAAAADDPAVAVIAGPGTGKTKTLVSRIAYLIEKKKVDPASITAVTFTRKAAQEMRQRLQHQFKGKRAADAIHIGTFHSLCMQMLKARQRDLTLLDESEAQSLAEEVLRRHSLSVSPKKWLQELSRFKNGADADETVLTEETREDYAALLRRYQAVDYDDLLLQAEALWSAEEALEESRAFTYLLVDEFQDINPVQYRLIRAWSRNAASVFVIGDPDQAIYGFRGSDSRCFARFQEDYAPVKTIRLLRNYRSTPQILRCALPMISAARDGEERRLEPQCPDGEAVSLLTAPDAFSEALFVAKEINRLVGGMDMLDTQGEGLHPHREKEARSFSDIAVLYRTHRQSETLEYCLRKESIPYVIAGLDQKPEQPLVRRTLAFFRFLLNPCDRLSLRRVLRETAGKAGREAAVQWEEAYSTGEREIGRLLSSAAELPSVQSCAPLKRLAEQTAKYAQRVRTESPETLLKAWVQDQGWEEQEGIDRLLHMAVLYSSMEELLEALAMGGEIDVARSSSRAYSPQAVTLLTLHGAKGLEFPVVFLCGVTEDILPLKPAQGVSDREEERRLFYVGMTRAKRELLMLTGENPSSFLQDIPSACLERGSTEQPFKGYTGKQLSLFD